MSIEILDPTFGDNVQEFAAAARLETLAGLTVGIVSNGKQGTRPFFDALEDALVNNYGVAEVVRTTKTNYSAPADAHIMDQASQWHAMISGIGD